MLEQSALPDFALQHLIERLESFDGLVQLPDSGRMVVENLANCRLGFALHPNTRQDYRSRGLLDEVMYVLALREHLGEEVNRHEFDFRIQHWTASCPARFSHEPAFFRFLQS